MKLSIVIPCYNEATTIVPLTDKLFNQFIQVEREFIIINDGSTDRSLQILNSLKAPDGVRLMVISHEKNQGKGQAIASAVPHCKGDFLIIQDADLELDPADLPLLIEPILNGRSEVVFGSRKKHGYHKMYLHSRIGNSVVNILTLLLYGKKLTDVSCGYKILPKDLFVQLNLKSIGFEFCTELTAKLINHNIAITEVEVKYNPRSYREGKKINWKDGFKAMWTLMANKLNDKSNLK